MTMPHESGVHESGGGDSVVHESALRLGTESAFGVLARAQILAKIWAEKGDKTGDKIINLGIGQPDFRTPPHIIEAAIKAMQDGAHGYTPSMGMPALREAVVADIEKRYAVQMERERVQIVPGGKPIMFMAMMLLGGEGREILTPDPGFPIYQSAIHYSGAKAVPYRLHEGHGFAFNADEVLKQVTAKTSLIIVNSPANPTGGVTPKSEIDKFVQGLAAFPHVMVLSDEIYDRLTFEGAPISMLTYPALREKLILLNGWSKSYAMTGWRLGYGIWPQALVEYADRLAVNFHSCVNAPTQYAGLAALQGDQACVEEMRAAFCTRARLITDRLNRIKGISCQQPKGAFYAFANISATGLTSTQFQNDALEKYGVACIAGTSFGQFGEGFVRFSCAAAEDDINHAMDRIEVMLQKHVPT